MNCSTVWRSPASALTSLLLALLLASPAAAQVQRETLEVVPHDLVVLAIPKLAQPGGTGAQATSVVWAVSDPIDTRFENWETAEAFKCVMVGPPPGGRLLVEATEINWDARTFSKRVWRILAKGTTPPGPGPGPGPGPDPTPTPVPVPPSVPEGFLGLTKATYGLCDYYKPSKANAAKAAAALQEAMKEKRGTLAAHFQAGDKAMRPLTEADAGLKAVMAGVEATTDKFWDAATLRSADDAVKAIKAVADGLKLWGEQTNAERLRPAMRVVADARP